LGVLYAPAQVLLLRMCAECLLEYIQRLAIRAIADRVYAELKPVLNRQFRGLADIRRILRVQAAALSPAPRIRY
jgi:hypothetical protein